MSRNMVEGQERPDLPGSGTPPLEGPLWFRIKLAVWAVALLVVLAGAFVVTRALSA